VDLCVHWVILIVLKVDMAMAMMEMPMAMNHFDLLGVEISDFCVKALMMSKKFSRLLSIVARQTSVTDLVIARFLMLVQKLIVYFGNQVLGIEYGGKIEGESYMNVYGSGRVTANVFEE
jgi:hypothetical protein